MMVDLEGLREIFRDSRLHVGIGVVTKLGLAPDNSVLRVQVSILPDQLEVICFMSFPQLLDVSFPQVDDLVIVVFCDGNPDEAHIISTMSAEDQPIPEFARTGHSVKYARTGKKLYLGSDTKIGLSRPAVEPTNPLVLGDILKTFLTNIITDILNASQIGWGPTGAVYLDPGIRTSLTNNLSTYVTTAATNFLSQLSYTERGA